MPSIWGSVSKYSQNSGSELSNPFGDLDADDPAVLAAIEVCQSAFTGIGFGFGG